MLQLHLLSARMLLCVAFFAATSVAGQDNVGCQEAELNKCGALPVSSATAELKSVSLLQKVQHRSRLDIAEAAIGPEIDAVVKVVQELQRGDASMEEGFCDLPLVGGKHTKVILDTAISVSSQNVRDGNLQHSDGSGDDPHGWGPKDSRLNDKNSCWLSEVNDLDQWIQWDFGKLKRVTKIQTLGRPERGKAGDEEWTSQYSLSYTKDGLSWTVLNETFMGNDNRTVPAEVVLDPPLLAVKLKLHPTKWQNRIALRAEIFGCPGYVTPAPVVCGSCPSCEFVPGTGQDKAAAAKCPYCAYGMLTAWPCNVKGLCRCSEPKAPCPPS